MKHFGKVKANGFNRNALDGAADGGAGAVDVIQLAGKQRFDAQVGADGHIQKIDAFVFVEALLCAVKQGSDRE
jgi:hypothetical protein